MKIIKRMFMAFPAFFLFICWSKAGVAADNRFKEVIKDSQYGGPAGELVGAAVMAFVKKAGGHLDYTAHRTTGVLEGTTSTPVKSPTPLAELENGKVTLAVPTIMPDIRDTNSKGQTPVIITAELFRGKF